jgi:RNA polymerase sigma factor (sigma-70 family)
VGDDSSIGRHLRSGQDRIARVGAAVEAFRRLSPEDYGYFLATIETDLNGGVPVLEGKSPLLLAASSTTSPQESAPQAAPSETLRQAVLGLLADGRDRSSQEIRQALEPSRPVKPGSLNTEMFTLRKLGLVRSEGSGNKRRHTITTRGASSRPSSTGKREGAQQRPAKNKRDDDEDHSARMQAHPVEHYEPPRTVRVKVPRTDRGHEPSLSAEQIYAAAISGHHLLSAAEELELAQRLEDTEVAIWQGLIAGRLEDEARALLRALDPPVEAATAAAARAADLDRLVASRVIGMFDQRLADPETTVHEAQRLKTDRAELRKLEREADRIRDRFATCNLRLVPSTIRRHGYHNTPGLSMSDLIQEGNLGLIKAIPRFDYRRGLRFSTFATWWIRHYLVRARQNFSTEVRVPVHLHDLASRARRAKDQLRKKLGRDPSRIEIASAIDVPVQSLAALDTAWLRHRESIPSFDSVSDGESGETPSYLTSDAPPTDEVLVRIQEEGQIAAAIADLPPLLAKVLRRRYGFDGGDHETLIQIGKSLRLSRERIRQLEVKALGMLRGKLGEIAIVTT